MPDNPLENKLFPFTLEIGQLLPEHPIESTNTTSPLAFTDNALPFGVEVDEDAFY